jgi:lipopolysaccharide biosynthesis glycosyltransferase
MESRGIIMFNRGEGIVLRAIVALFSLRKHYDGPITFYVEDPYPHEFDEVLKYFKCDIIHNEIRHDYKTLVRKNSLFENPPYDKTLWIDADVIVNGPVDKMFDYLDEKEVDFCIPHFAGWKSTGPSISKRINRFKGIAEDRHMAEALKEHPAINTGILSFKKSDKWKEFVRYWTDLAQRGSIARIFIPDETAAQVLYPSIGEWGLKYFIAPTDYNVSPLHDHGLSKNPVIHHFHGDKHCLKNVPDCKIWTDTFEEMRKDNIAGINSFLKYADKRLAIYLKGDLKGDNTSNLLPHQKADTTIVTAIDEHYLPILQVTFQNWRKYKKIDNYPVIIFVNGIVLTDTRLDFLRLPNIQLINWDETCMDKVDSHRELMLSAFVFGVNDHVKTEYWLKLDADSYATNSVPFITEEMKQYSVYSHRWGYSRPEHIKMLDLWSKNCWHKKIANAQSMIEQGRIEGNRFYHNNKRIISYICFQKTRFTRYCVKLFGKRRLPCPSQDTVAYYLLQRLKPEALGIGNFKRQFGFTQGRGRLGADHIKKCVKQVDIDNANLL